MSCIRTVGLSTRRHDPPVSNSKTHILVVGDAQEAATLFGRPGTTGVHFSRYARGNDKTAPLRQPGRRYDWILVNVASFDGDEKDLIQSLSVAGFFIADRKQREGHRPCGVEWLADGRLQMHCCKHDSTPKPCASSRYDMPDDDSFVFEYQAPVKQLK